MAHALMRAASRLISTLVVGNEQTVSAALEGGEKRQALHADEERGAFIAGFRVTLLWLFGRQIRVMDSAAVSFPAASVVSIPDYTRTCPKGVQAFVPLRKTTIGPEVVIRV